MANKLTVYGIGSTHHSELSKSSTIQVLEARGSIVFWCDCWEVRAATGNCALQKKKWNHKIIFGIAWSKYKLLTFHSLPFLILFLPSSLRAGASPEEIGARTKKAKRSCDTVTIGDDNAVISVRFMMGSPKLLEEILHHLGCTKNNKTYENPDVTYITLYNYCRV